MLKTVFLLSVLLIGSARAAPPAPDSDDASIMHGHEAWIEKQETHVGALCCSMADGRPLMDNEIRQRDGHWQVFYAKTHWDGGTDEWLDVPQNAVLPNMSPVGFPIVWVYYGQVRCLALSGAV